MAHRPWLQQIRLAGCRTPQRPPQAGFSIIEILVGLAIGLASMLAIYQLYGVSEKQRRTVSSASDAQSAGALALFSIERDIRSAGLGFAAMEPRHLGCAVQAHNNGRAFTFPLVPVRISVTGGTQLWVLTGSSPNMVTGSRYEASANGVFSMEKSNAGLHAGDVAVGTSDSDLRQCLLMEITAGDRSTVATGTGSEPYPDKRVSQGTGSYSNFYTGTTVTPRYNDGSRRNMLDGGTTSLGEGAIYTLGPEPQLHVWSLNGNELVYYNHLNETSESSVAVAHDVLSFQAEYGYDINGDGQIDNRAEWTASPSLSGSNTEPDWDKVLAVRIAVVVRSSQFERDEVTAEPPRWASGSKQFWTDEDAPGSDWKHYRYRVYESVIPLRNTLWGQLAP
ncbi:MAG: PilW family protein [Comamonas sp.]|nr:PilW family protein [Comamonas sp.]